MDKKRYARKQESAGITCDLLSLLLCSERNTLESYTWVFMLNRPKLLSVSRAWDLSYCSTLLIAINKRYIRGVPAFGSNR